MYGCLFLLFIVLPLFLLSALWYVAKALFGVRRPLGQSDGTVNRAQPKGKAGNSADKANPKNGKKNFDRDEGEYIDFEEVKN